MIMRTSASRGGDPAALRILLPYDGASFGGSHVSSLLLARALAERGHQPIVAVHGDGRVADEARAAGLQVERLDALWRKAPPRGSGGVRLEHLLALAPAMGALLRLKPHLVHVNDLSMLRVWGPATRLAGVPLVKHWRSNYRRSASVDLGLRCASAVIAVSAAARDRLPAFVRGRTTVEYNPIEAPKASPPDAAAAKAAVGLPPDALLLGVFGALSKRKRPHVLAEVLHRLPQAIGGRPLLGLAAGEPFSPPDEKLEVLIKAYCLDTRLLRPGFVRPAAPWMTACDLVLVPAVDEPFGRTPFEALACGAPVIVSTGCGATEVLKDDWDAVVLDPEPVHAWAVAAGALLSDRARIDRLVRNGRATLNRLSPQAHAQRVEAVYGAVLSRRAAPILEGAPT